jgi:hypothetical protein
MDVDREGVQIKSNQESIMITTTFTYQSATSTYEIKVDRTKTTATAQWLRKYQVNRFRTKTAGNVTSFFVYARNMSAIAVQKLNAKFNPPAPAPKTFAPTVFRYKKGYELLVDSSKAIATTEWLESRGCQFDRYISGNTTRYVFAVIPTAVVDAIASLYPLVNEDEPQPAALEAVELPEAIAARFVNSLEYSYIDWGINLPEGGVYSTRVFVDTEVAVALGFDKKDGAVLHTQHGAVDWYSKGLDCPDEGYVCPLTHKVFQGELGLELIFSFPAFQVAAA